MQQLQSPDVNGNAIWRLNCMHWSIRNQNNFSPAIAWEIAEQEPQVKFVMNFEKHITFRKWCHGTIIWSFRKSAYHDMAYHHHYCAMAPSTICISTQSNSWHWFMLIMDYPDHITWRCRFLQLSTEKKAKKSCQEQCGLQHKRKTMMAGNHIEGSPWCRNIVIFHDTWLTTLPKISTRLSHLASETHSSAQSRESLAWGQFPRLNHCELGGEDAKSTCNTSSSCTIWR